MAFNEEIEKPLKLKKNPKCQLLQIFRKTERKKDSLTNSKRPTPPPLKKKRRRSVYVTNTKS